MPAMKPDDRALAHWRAAYIEGVKRAIAEHPEDYGTAVVAAPRTMIENMITATLRDTHNHSGHGFRNACKHLGIKHTRKAIRDFIEGR